jgi:hypothetical protein
MVVLRLTGQILIAVSLMLLGSDAITSLKADAVELMSLNEFVGLIGLGNPLASVEAGLEQGEVVKFFSKGGALILKQASWVTLGFIGIVLAWAGDVRARS